MRALTVEELGFVSGGFGELPNNDGGGNPRYGEIGFSWWSDRWGDLKKAGGAITSAVSSALADAIARGEVRLGGSATTGPGTMPCYDQHGQVIRNNYGNPLLACRSVSGSLSFSFGPKE
jgi:hypothetical protein